MANRSASSRKTNKTGVRRVKSKGMIADALQYEEIYEELWNNGDVQKKAGWLKDECFQNAIYWAGCDWKELKTQHRKRWRSAKNIIVREMMVHISL